MRVGGVAVAPTVQNAAKAHSEDYRDKHMKYDKRDRLKEN